MGFRLTCFAYFVCNSFDPSATLIHLAVSISVSTSFRYCLLRCLQIKSLIRIRNLTIWFTKFRSSIHTPRNVWCVVLSLQLRPNSFRLILFRVVVSFVFFFFGIKPTECLFIIEFHLFACHYSCLLPATLCMYVIFPHNMQTTHISRLVSKSISKALNFVIVITVVTFFLPFYLSLSLVLSAFGAKMWLSHAPVCFDFRHSHSFFLAVYVSLCIALVGICQNSFPFYVFIFLHSHALPMNGVRIYDSFWLKWFECQMEKTRQTASFIVMHFITFFMHMIVWRMS